MTQSLPAECLCFHLVNAVRKRRGQDRPCVRNAHVLYPSGALCGTSAVCIGKPLPHLLFLLQAYKLCGDSAFLVNCPKGKKEEALGYLKNIRKKNEIQMLALLGRDPLLLEPGPPATEYV